MTERELRRLHDRHIKQHQARMSKLLMEYQDAFMENIEVKGEFVEKNDTLKEIQFKLSDKWRKYCNRWRNKKTVGNLQPKVHQFDDMVAHFDEYTFKAHYAITIGETLKANGITEPAESFYPKPLKVIIDKKS
jgi:hypothetical protein